MSQILGTIDDRYDSYLAGVRPIRVDPSSHALITMTYQHSEIHKGEYYHIADVQAIDTTTMYWMLTTPDTTTYCHMLISLECTGEVLYALSEGADRTGTTLLSPINHNRNSTNVATMLTHRAYSGGTTNGTTIDQVRSGATGVATKTVASGNPRAREEWILKRNTKYIIALTTYAAVVASISFDWYEHADKDT